jgi:DNA polymerase-3 subunit delta'
MVRPRGDFRDEVMNAPLNFQSFLGNRRVVEILRKAVEQDRLPHALIFAGPPGVGKRTLAELLAQRLNCLQRQNQEACGACISCRKIAAGTHPDVLLIKPDGAYIKIDQVRDMIGEIAYKPFEGRYRVVILDGADQMRPEGANCLLKTLEEPPSQSILILVTARPYLLLSTIRSRARLLQLGPIAADVIESHLVAQEGRSLEDARMAATLSNGSLSAALACDTERHREIRSTALSFVSLLLRKGEFAQASTLATGITKEKEAFQVWIDLAQVLLQDVYYAQMAPKQMSQADLAGELAALAQTTPHAAVIAAIKAFRQLRAALQQNVNRQLALEALFLAELPDTLSR